MNDKKKTMNNDTNGSLVKGSAWMTAGSIFSRILGAIYIIPWNAWMGTAAVALAANALYAKGYNIYSEFLIISTAGIPGAISKQISHYNALNEYSAGNKLFKQGLKLMIGLGIIFAGVMFFGTKYLAKIFAGGDMTTIPVLKSLSFAVLIIPILSITRGYFQGYGQMAPSAISQIIEQIARVFYMLLATYLIMQVQHGNYVNAVTQSTFAAFVGAIISLALLGYYLIRQLPKLRHLSRNSNNEVNINNKKLLLEIFQQAIPFIIMGSGIVMYQTFDQSTFNLMMNKVGSYSKTTLDQMYALFGFNSNKLIMIVVSLAVAVSEAAIPLLSQAHAKNDKENIKKEISKIFQLFSFVMIPASIGMYGVARSLWTTFYVYNSIGIKMLQFSSILSIILGLFTILGAILQGLYKNKLAIRQLLIGLAVKVVVQYPMIVLFKEFGPLVATFLGMTVSSMLMLQTLIKEFEINPTQTLTNVGKIIIYSLEMLLVVFLIDLVIYKFTGNVGRIVGLIILLIEAGIGGYIYSYLTLKSHLADKILGYSMDRFRRLLRIK
ncbi:putative polysaccharide biosynthesis protein [Companilactobacillus sp. DQM5]|uniref:putative polysaccharide biosynthesis protein n=1 Tax=Companilactobacillus sp. DQM5 TaxID=3463359 RepID=UPI004058C02C